MTGHGGERDFVGWLRDLLHERTGLECETLDAIEADVRREFGGGEVYVHRRVKRSRLQALEAQPPQAPGKAKAQALGVSERQFYRLQSLLRTD